MRRIAVALIVVSAIVVSAMPAGAQPLQARLSQCLAIPGVLQRLACYDGVAKAAGAVAPSSSSPSVYRTPPASVAASAPPSLGSERLPQTAAAAMVSRPNAVSARVASVVFNPYHRFTVTLENGEVWRQVPGDQVILRESRIEAVRITRGAVGSYDLVVIGHNPSYKVTRLQ